MADNSHPSTPLFNSDGTLTSAGAYSVGDFWYGKNGIDFLLGQYLYQGFSSVLPNRRKFRILRQGRFSSIRRGGCAHRVKPAEAKNLNAEAAEAQRKAAPVVRDDDVTEAPACGVRAIYRRFGLARSAAGAPLPPSFK